MGWLDMKLIVVSVVVGFLYMSTSSSLCCVILDHSPVYNGKKYLLKLDIQVVKRKDYNQLYST